MFNPWVLIMVGLAFVLSNAASFLKGEQVERDRALAAAFTSQAAVIRTFNGHTAEDLKAAQRAAEREGAAQVAALNNIHAFELEVKNGLIKDAFGLAQAAGACNVSAAGIGVLNSAIDAYNAAAASSGVRVDAVPPDGPPRPPAPRSRGRAADTVGGPEPGGRPVRADAPGGRRLAAAPG